MIPFFLMILVATFAMGWLFISLFWDEEAGECSLLRFCLAWGFGSGVLSLLCFSYLVILGGGYREWLTPVVAALLAILVISQRKTCLPRGILKGDYSLRSPFTIILVLAVFSALADSVMTSLVHPHGWGDPLSIWNYRARALFGSGTDWQSAFREGAGENPEYPLLNPAYTLLVWEMLGSAYLPVLATTALLFNFATVGILWSAIRLLNDRVTASIAAIVLLGVPAMTANSAGQYNDVRLAFFMLSACIFSAIHRRFRLKDARLLILTGFALGLAAWTKNEGLFFCAAFMSGHLIYRRFECGTIPWREFRAIASGAALPLLLLSWFKSMVPTDTVIRRLLGSPLLDRLFDVSRHVEILSSVAAFFTEHQLLLYVFLAVYLVSCRQSPDRRILLIVGITAVGYYLVYLLTSVRLTWHLETSLSRLLLQLLPVVLFALFRTEPRAGTGNAPIDAATDRGMVRAASGD